MFRKIILLLSILFAQNANAGEIVPYKAPEITGIEKWINSEPLTIKSLKGKVVLVDFWAYSCINCLRTFPHLKEWYKKYHDAGFEIIGVHSPEFEFEKNFDNVKKAVDKFSLKHPIALDNNRKTWENYQNLYWPAHYLINKEGKVVYTHFGEGEYDITENHIRALLGMSKIEPTTLENQPRNNDLTPETYLGNHRASTFSSPQKLIDTQSFTFPVALPIDRWGLSGSWSVSKEHITAQEAGAKLQLRFYAGKVFAVLGNQDGKPVDINITLNGKPAGNKITVNQHTLYEIIVQDTAQMGLLEITAHGPGLEAYTFTFGN